MGGVVTESRGKSVHLLGELKWSPRRSSVGLLAIAHSQLMTRGVRLVDAAALLEVVGVDDE